MPEAPIQLLPPQSRQLLVDPCVLSAHRVPPYLVLLYVVEAAERHDIPFGIGAPDLDGFNMAGVGFVKAANETRPVMVRVQ